MCANGVDASLSPATQAQPKKKKILTFHIKLSKHRTQHRVSAHSLLPYFAFVLHRQMPDGVSRNTKYVKRNELKITKNGTKKNATAKSHVRKRIFYSDGRMQYRTAAMAAMRRKRQREVILR